MAALFNFSILHYCYYEKTLQETPFIIFLESSYIFILIRLCLYLTRDVYVASPNPLKSHL